jgi:hypothetical protein
MKKITLIIMIMPVLLLISCGDGGDYYDDSHSLVGLWASTDYTIISVGAPQHCKLYILPDRQFYFLYYTHLNDPLPLHTAPYISVKGIILNEIDLDNYPREGMFLQLDIIEAFDGSNFIPTALPDLNIYIDELGPTNLRFQNDINFNNVLYEGVDGLGHFIRLVE